MNNSNLKKLFKGIKHLEHAFTHKSWVNEHPNLRTSNERLEFLGDAILEFIVSDELYSRFPQKEEGYLTALRANIVNTTNLASVARTLDIGKSLFLSKGEEESGGRNNSSLLADTMEAIIGALYLDGGLKIAKIFIHEYLLSDIDQKVQKPLKDAKSILQELVQSQGSPAPKYKVVNEFGPDHDKIFNMEVLVNGKKLGKGKGKNKAEAAQSAAEDALLRQKQG